MTYKITTHSRPSEDDPTVVVTYAEAEAPRDLLSYAYAERTTASGFGPTPSTRVTLATDGTYFDPDLPDEDGCPVFDLRDDVGRALAAALTAHYAAIDGNPERVVLVSAEAGPADRISATRITVDDAGTLGLSDNERGVVFVAARGHWTRATYETAEADK